MTRPLSHHRLHAELHNSELLSQPTTVRTRAVEEMILDRRQRQTAFATGEKPDALEFVQTVLGSAVTNLASLYSQAREGELQGVPDNADLSEAGEARAIRIYQDFDLGAERTAAAAVAEQPNF